MIDVKVQRTHYNGQEWVGLPAVQYQKLLAVVRAVQKHLYEGYAHEELVEALAALEGGE